MIKTPTNSSSSKNGANSPAPNRVSIKEANDHLQLLHQKVNELQEIIKEQNEALKRKDSIFEKQLNELKNGRDLQITELTKTIVKLEDKIKDLEMGMKEKNLKLEQNQGKVYLVDKLVDASVPILENLLIEMKKLNEINGDGNLNLVKERFHILEKRYDEAMTNYCESESNSTSVGINAISDLMGTPDSNSSGSNKIANKETQSSGSSANGESGFVSSHNSIILSPEKSNQDLIANEIKDKNEPVTIGLIAPILCQDACKISHNSSFEHLNLIDDERKLEPSPPFEEDQKEVIIKPKQYNWHSVKARNRSHRSFSIREHLSEAKSKCLPEIRRSSIDAGMNSSQSTPSHNNHYSDSHSAPNHRNSSLKVAKSFSITSNFSEDEEMPVVNLPQVTSKHGTYSKTAV